VGDAGDFELAVEELLRANPSRHQAMPMGAAETVVLGGVAIQDRR
jgi:cytochrome P450